MSNVRKIELPYRVLQLNIACGRAAVEDTVSPNEESIVARPRKIPCTHGPHPPKATNGVCVYCHREAANRYREQHAEERKSYQREWYKRNKETQKEKMRTYYAENRETLLQKERDKWASASEEYKQYKLSKRAEHRLANYAQSMVTAACWRAERRGVPFDMCKEDIEPLPTRCPALGIELKYARGGKADNSPTVDRLIPEKGYVAGNVVVVSELANRIKSNATTAQVRAVADWMEKTIR